jgi:hypothetical protein
MAPEIDTLIRTRIRSGTLPPFSKGHQLFGGSGEGDTCSCCGQSISKAEVQYDVDFGHNQLPLRMHRRCYQIWYGETKAATSKDQRLS